METTTLKRTWKVDTNHSTIGFKVKHLGIAEISGSFTDYEGTVTLADDEFTIQAVSLRIQTDSISTGNVMRDNHLKTEEFFDTAGFPLITFTSTGVTRKSANQFAVDGLLKIKDVSKPVQLLAEKLGLARDMWGNEVAAFQVHGSFNRLDYNVKWHQFLDNGAAVISNEIALNILVELQPEAE